MAASHAAVLVKGQSDPGSLTNEDQFAATNALDELFWAYQMYFSEMKAGAHSEERHDRVLATLPPSPLLKWWWTGNRNQFDPDFIDAVNEHWEQVDRLSEEEAVTG